MLSALLAAGVWLFIASSRGWPISTTHSIIGAIVGFAIVAIGIDSVNWQKIWLIITSWVLSPLIAGILSFLIYKSVCRLVLDRDNQLLHARRYVPIYIFLAGFVIVLITLLKGLKHVGRGSQHSRPMWLPRSLAWFWPLRGQFTFAR